MVLVVDVGTSSTKAGIVDEFGNLISSHEVENRILSPERGAAEHDPEELLNNLIRAAFKAVRGHEEDVDTLVLSSYQLGLIPLDADSKPLMGLVTLLDTRAQESFDELVRNVDSDEIYKRTGCPSSYLYPFSKILWLRREKPDIFKKARYFLDSKSYIVYRLTGRILTEPSMASATQMFNIEKKRWDDYTLSILGIEPDNLPNVIDGDEIVGEISSDITEEIGLKRKVKLLLGVYDGGGLVLGLGGLTEGVGSVNLGTTSMLRVSADRPVLDDQKRLQTYYFFKDTWLTGEGINNAGVVLRWLRKLFSKENYDELNELARGVKPGSDGLIFLPYLTGERDPRIGSSASGTVHGLRESHTLGHLVRALFEGVAYTLRMVKEALEENSIDVREIRVGGSGTRSRIWLETIANVLRIPVRRAKIGHVSFVGEAMLGYVASGVYRSIQEAEENMISLEDPIFPDEKTLPVYEENYRKFKKLVSLMREFQSNA